MFIPAELIKSIGKEMIAYLGWGQGWHGWRPGRLGRLERSALATPAGGCLLECSGLITLPPFQYSFTCNCGSIGTRPIYVPGDSFQHPASRHVTVHTSDAVHYHELSKKDSNSGLNYLILLPSLFKLPGVYFIESVPQGYNMKICQITNFIFPAHFKVKRSRVCDKAPQNYLFTKIRDRERGESCNIDNTNPWTINRREGNILTVWKKTEQQKLSGRIDRKEDIILADGRRDGRTVYNLGQ